MENIVKKVIMYAILGAGFPLFGMYSYESMDLDLINDRSKSFIDERKVSDILRDQDTFEAVPTWQDIIKLVYQGCLTSDVLERYVRHRIDERIAYFKRLLHQSQFRKLSQHEWDSIPPCVVCNKNLTSYDLLDAAYVYSDMRAKWAYEKFLHMQFGWEEKVKRAEGFLVEKTMFIDDCFLANIFSVLFHIEHEITHLFQRENVQKFGIKAFVNNRSVSYLANCDVRKYLTSNDRASFIVDLKTREKEADQCGAVFIPNNELLRRYCLIDIKNGLDTECCGKGYLSLRETIEYNKNYRYIKDDGVKAFDDVLNEIKQLEQGNSDSEARYKNNLKKDVHRELFNEICEKL